MNAARRHNSLMARRPRNKPLRLLLRALILIGLLACAYALWPYLTLWRIEAAAGTADPSALENYVDLPRVRQEAHNWFNKEHPGQIEEVSDEFADWVEQGLRDHGNQALDKLITLDWIRARLVPPSIADLGFLSRTRLALFDGLTGFRVHLFASHEQPPTRLYLELDTGGWRVTAVYF